MRNVILMIYAIDYGLLLWLLLAPRKGRPHQLQRKPPKNIQKIPLVLLKFVTSFEAICVREKSEEERRESDRNCEKF